MDNSHVLLARQPIFDRKLNVVAYELLFRASTDNRADFIDGDHATSQVLLNAFTELNITDVVGNNKAFINFTRNLILTPQPFEKNHFVVEVLEGLKVDAELIEGIKQLKDKGYTVALDDFVLQEENLKLLDYADIVKLDVLHHSSAELEQAVATLSNYPVKLLAEKVENHKMFDHCANLGFQLFQGYFLSKPQIIKGKRVPENKRSVVSLIAKLNDSDVEIDELNCLISKDPVLSYKLLRLINSAAFGPSREVDSIQRAITLLGLDQLKSWVTLLSLSKLDDKPSELFVNTMVRAKMCENIGMQLTDVSEPHHHYTVGLLSTLDAFIDQSLNKLIPNLNLVPTISDALLEHKGELGKVLEAVIQFEHANWDNIDWDWLHLKGVSAEDMESAYIGATAWANEAHQSIADQ